MLCKYCQSENTIKYGTYTTTENEEIQCYFCKNCNRKFTELDTLFDMRTPTNQITEAMSMYYGGMPLDSIQRHLKQEFNNDITEMAIYKWIIRFTENAIEQTKNFTPKVGNIWIADETAIEVDGRKVWFWDIVDADSRFLLASHISKARTVEDAQSLIQKAVSRAKKLPEVILTDKLKAYIDGIALASGGEITHIQSKPFTDKDLSTNKIERFHGTLKDRINVVRGFKTLVTAQLLTDGWLIHYNFFKQHESLGNVPPAENMGIAMPCRNWIDIVRSSDRYANTGAVFSTIRPEYMRTVPMTDKQKSSQKRRLQIRRYAARQRGEIITPSIQIMKRGRKKKL